jgi:ubiquinone/menaquinone biosynthesis C-methylase UbiE
MVSEYPNCTYDGCDIVNVINENFKPPQFCYSYGNVLEGLDYEDNTFDFVHIRCLILAIREDEWPKVIKEAIRVTKPGGMIMFVEIDLRVRHTFLYMYFNYST